MLSRLVRSVFGQATAGRSPLDAVLGISNPALRQLFGATYRRELDHSPEARAVVVAALETAFGEDPLPSVVELLEVVPRWDAWCRSQRTTPERAMLNGAIKNALETANQMAAKLYGSRLPMPTPALASALEAVAALVARGDHGRYGGAGWFEPLIREAMARGDAESRAAVIAAFERLLGAEKSRLDDAIVRVEALLAMSGLQRGEVPALVVLDQRTASLDENRARVFGILGEPLGGALAAILDGDRMARAMSLPEAVKHPALRALADLSPEDRGEMFHRLLGWMANNLTQFGTAGWNEVQKRNGRYTHSIVPRDMPTQVGNLLGVLASRKITLVDPDADVAAFLAVLHHFPLLGYKKIVELVLGTVKAQPHGRAAAALRVAIASDKNVHGLRDHIVAIEELLRSLPVATPASAGPGGFGRKAVASVLPGLPPLVPPAFALDSWTAKETLTRHFDNLLDVRLHDAPHRDLLARLDAVARGMTAISDTNPADQAARADHAGALFRAHGFELKGDTDNHRQARVIAETVQTGADLHARFRAATALVTAYPQAARTLGRLAADLSGKAQPTAKWLAEGEALAQAIPAAARLALIAELVRAPTPLSCLPANSDHVRALLFLSVDLDASDLGPLLTDYALKRCYVTLPGVGIRNEKIGNACVWTLAALPEGAGVPYLARILARTKYPKIKVKIDAKLNDAATAAGIERATLDELTVPTHDLSPDGKRKVALGDGSATIRLVDGRSVAIDWACAGYKPLKAPSVAMRADAEALKAIRTAAKELEADLAIQAGRLQQLYLADRRWTAEIWHERYLNHPLLRALASRLIWWVERDGGRVAVLPDGDGVADVSGRSVRLNGATVALWHPYDASVAEIDAWRDRLEALAVTQPFAQAWREVYALTDAERATGTYSNRWAAHLLKQHQAMTLARLNGWRVTHRMWVDAPNDAPWHLAIPAHGLVADYWVEGAGGEDPEVSESGAYTYVATDRVQFHAAEGGDSGRGPQRDHAVPLTEVPPIVFSEVMRHADLITAVASIAADPNWLDRGVDAAHPSQWGQAAAAYWQRANTADLEESGKRRRSMLERIVPRLKIANKLALEDRYLVVEGSRHRYRIHLGSGASFRGERHICIVPAGEREGGRLWLPFEGDRTLSIILSKAALLAADAKITDPVILAQL